MVGVADYTGTSHLVALYVNGTLQGSDTVHSGTIEPANNSGTLYIGGTSNALDGNIGMLRIYNRVLSPEEIAEHYNQDKALLAP